MFNSASDECHPFPFFSIFVSFFLCYFLPQFLRYLSRYAFSFIPLHPIQRLDSHRTQRKKSLLILRKCYEIVKQINGEFDLHNLQSIFIFVDAMRAKEARNGKVLLVCTFALSILPKSKEEKTSTDVRILCVFRWCVCQTFLNIDNKRIHYGVDRLISHFERRKKRNIHIEHNEHEGRRRKQVVKRETEIIEHSERVSNSSLISFHILHSLRVDIHALPIVTKKRTKNESPFEIQFIGKNCHENWMNKYDSCAPNTHVWQLWREKYFIFSHSVSFPAFDRIV